MISSQCLEDYPNVCPTDINCSCKNINQIIKYDQKVNPNGNYNNDRQSKYMKKLFPDLDLPFVFNFKPDDTFVNCTVI